MSLRFVVRIAPALLVTALAVAQRPTVGAAAPPIVADDWLNWEGDGPTLESLAGRVVLLEFWGTWCGPCVRAMPGIQKLHDRYADRGLTVLAISYEPAATMRPFLTKNGYTMAVGSDPGKRTIAAYGVSGWPMTVVIDKQGKIAHVGSPYDAEVQVEKALGLEAGPAALLNLYLDSVAGSDEAAQRDALERLTQKATNDFDLQAWARSHTGVETVADGGSEPSPRQAGGRATGNAGDGIAVLERCIKSWTDESRRASLLQQLADTGPAKFDLASFARDRFADAYPFKASELKAMLEAKRYSGVVDAIAERRPSSKVLATAAKHRDFATFCEDKSGAARTMAKKGLMAQCWVFPGALPADEELNGKFFGELAISGIATSKDKKTITGIMLGGELVKSDEVERFIVSHLTQALLMESLGAGKAPKLGRLDKQLAKERKSIVRDLESRYGKPRSRGKE